MRDEFHRSIANGTRMITDFIADIAVLTQRRKEARTQSHRNREWAPGFRMGVRLRGQVLSRGWRLKCGRDARTTLALDVSENVGKVWCARLARRWDPEETGRPRARWERCHASAPRLGKRDGSGARHPFATKREPGTESAFRRRVASPKGHRRHNVEPGTPR